MTLRATLQLTIIMISVRSSPSVHTVDSVVPLTQSIICHAKDLSMELYTGLGDAYRYDRHRWML